MVKNKDDISAFKDYVPSDDKGGAAAAPAKTEAAPTPAPAAPPKPVETPKQTAPVTHHQFRPHHNQEYNKLHLKVEEEFLPHHLLVNWPQKET